MGMIALALNPNLTTKEFLELAAQHRQDVADVLEHFEECAKQLPIEQRLLYIQSVFPLLCVYALT